LEVSNEVAKYLVATPVTAKRAAELITRYPDRFVFGFDEARRRVRAWEKRSLKAAAD
jgi:hypothetical protein